MSGNAVADIQLMFNACALDELQTIKFATIATHCWSKLGVMSEEKKELYVLK